MKKILYHSIFLLIGLVYFTSCELDNIPAPDAQLTGKIIDDATDSLVLQDLMSGSTLDFYEDKYGTKATKTALYIRNDGTYTNNLMFSGFYTVITPNANWYPIDSLKGFSLKPGGNSLDLRVTPYIRVKNFRVVNNAGVIEAYFTLEGGKTTSTFKTLTLCAHSDPRVAIGLRFTVQSAAIAATGTTPAVLATTPVFTASATNGNGAITNSEIKLTMNTKAPNDKVFISGRTYYFRVAALSSVSGAKENYSSAIAVVL